MYSKEPILFVCLGRAGDIILMSPGFKAIYDATGIKPIVMVLTEFACVLNGMSYVTPWVVGIGDSTECARIARTRYEFVIVPKWWEDSSTPRVTPPPLIPTVTLTHKGQKWVLPAKDWDNYMVSQWEHAGFTKEQMMEWPVVFDRRNQHNEQMLRVRYFRTQKPKLLVNYSGRTSPLPKDMVNAVAREVARFNQQFEVIDLSKIKAHCLQDLLGLYDHAQCLITSDTSTLHLAGASKIPYIALRANSGGGSVPRGNCVLMMRYAEIPNRVQEINQQLQKWIRGDTSWVRAITPSRDEEMTFSTT